MVLIIERYKEIIQNYNEFLDAVKKPLIQTIRVNTLKITPSKLSRILTEKGWKLKPNKYFKIVFEVESQLSIADTLEFYLGYFYIQEISSLIPVLALDPKAGEKILDLCAAPGGKTTFIAQLMQNKGLVVANDINFKRQRALMANIYKLGVLNTIVTNFNGLFFPHKIEFDKVLVDAPCSAEANRIYDNKKNYVDTHFIKKISGLQKGLLSKAVDLVKPGGIIVYSTCTFSPEENEEVVNYVLNKKNVKLVKIDLNIPHQKGLTRWQRKEFNQDLELCMRVYPHHLFSGGGFVAKLIKAK